MRRVILPNVNPESRRGAGAATASGSGAIVNHWSSVCALISIKRILSIKRMQCDELYTIIVN